MCRKNNDFAAGTIVVHERSTQSLDSLTAHASIDTRWLEPALPHLERLTRAEVEPMRRFLQRETALSNRAALATQLATRARTRLALDSPINGNWEADMALLQRIVAQHER